jgi:superfamily II DNA helicase RecQ
MITSEVEKLVKELYQELQVRESQELARIQDVINLVTNTQCFAKSLSKHFGDELPDGRYECGNCTWCETRKAVELVKPPPVAWDHARFKAVLDTVTARDDARFLARVAFGILSPRVSQLKSNSTPVWGSMADHDFEVCCADSNVDLVNHLDRSYTMPL